ncbi:MAG: hypothetical protein QXS00_06175 [Pyrobaculum sp.]|uniref:hypothetical protein n=1 Tax=Pyrobaculum sp. TaxID=2004705 RepID=UPI0031647D40
MTKQEYKRGGASPSPSYYGSLLEMLRSSGLNIITAEATRISRQRWKLQIG